MNHYWTELDWNVFLIIRAKKGTLAFSLRGLCIFVRLISALLPDEVSVQTVSQMSHQQSQSADKVAIYHLVLTFPLPALLRVLKHVKFALKKRLKETLI